MSLVNLGSAGAVIVALVLILKTKAEADHDAATAKAEADEKIFNRVDKIVDRHLAAEESNRKQVSELAESNRNLFDRVISVCTGLGTAIQELSTNTKANEKALQDLSSSTKANEKAIQDLRHEFRSLGVTEQRKALGHDEAPPFAAR